MSLKVEGAPFEDPFGHGDYIPEVQDLKVFRGIGTYGVHFEYLTPPAISPTDRSVGPSIDYIWDVIKNKKI